MARHPMIPTTGKSKSSSLPLCSFYRTLTASLRRAIQRLSAFMQPVLDAVMAHTGWKCTFIAGGPQPAAGGDLNIMRYVSPSYDMDNCILTSFHSLYSGKTAGEVPMSWMEMERPLFKMFIYPSFGRFLQQSYCKYTFSNIFVRDI